MIARGAALLALALVAAGTWPAFAPLASPTREERFAIPNGTFARRMAGDPVEILPSEIRLTLGVRDVLVLENHDDVPQIFGPTLLMPGQTFKLPFRVASSNYFTCTAHASGKLLVTVEPYPDTPWARLAWRIREATSR